MCLIIAKGHKRDTPRALVHLQTETVNPLHLARTPVRLVPYREVFRDVLEWIVTGRDLSHCRGVPDNRHVTTLDASDFLLQCIHGMTTKGGGSDYKTTPSGRIVHVTRLRAQVYHARERQ